jgi:hypothetical protein
VNEEADAGIASGTSSTMPGEAVGPALADGLFQFIFLLSSQRSTQIIISSYIIDFHRTDVNQGLALILD